MHDEASRHDWDWFEPELAYDNARLPEALIRAGMVLGEAGNDRTRPGDAALADRRSRPGRAARSARSAANGFGRPYAPPLAFDQQPVEAAATIDACAAAFDATGHDEWRAHARHAFGWFFGDNDAGVPLADFRDGGCFDGLMATGINRNQGAESILSLHLAALTMQAGLWLRPNGLDRTPTSPQKRGLSPLSNKVHDPISTPSAAAEGGSFASRRSALPPCLAGQPAHPARAQRLVDAVLGLDDREARPPAQIGDAGFRAAPLADAQGLPQALRRDLRRCSTCRSKGSATSASS